MNAIIETLPESVNGFTDVTGTGEGRRLIATRFLGRTADGDRVHVTVNLKETSSVAPHESTDHESVASIVELSIQGIVTAKHCREPHGAGQVREDAARVVEPAKGLTVADVARLVEIWDRWHLNGMRAGCAHQTAVYEDGRYGRQVDLTNTPACPITGYKYGHAWLVEHLPADVVADLSDIISRAPASH